MTVVGESDGGIIVGSIMKGYLLFFLLTQILNNIFFI
jgi:hypothetical protein